MTRASAGLLALAVTLGVVLAGCSPAQWAGERWTGNPPTPAPIPPPAEGRDEVRPLVPMPVGPLEDPPGEYPWHRDIVATTFWVGEVFDPDAPDGSQRISAYDSDWLESYGGCDGVLVRGYCTTEPRTAENDWFPTRMTPQQNPFYLDLPYDDVNDPTAFALRDAVVPWADDQPYASHRGDRRFSYLKNRWVAIVHEGRTCYGQVQDAGPGVYDDAAYVFGADDRRPANDEFGGAGMDVSPALTGCLGFPELNGSTARVDWRFVEDEDVPPGPWTNLITTQQVRR